LPKGKTIHDAVDNKEVEHIGVKIKKSKIGKKLKNN
jgi:hypothetical protein